MTPPHLAFALFPAESIGLAQAGSPTIFASQACFASQASAARSQARSVGQLRRQKGRREGGCCFARRIGKRAGRGSRLEHPR